MRLTVGNWHRRQMEFFFAVLKTLLDHYSISFHSRCITKFFNLVLFQIFTLMYLIPIINTTDYYSKCVTSVYYTFKHMCYNIWTCWRWCIFLQYHNALKCINHGKKITKLQQPEEQWFHDVMQLSGLQDLCMTGYTIINHDIPSAFMERWHSKTSSFHLLIGEMSVTLNDVSSLLHLSFRGRLLDYSIITRPDALDMMVTYLGADLDDVQKEIDNTRWCHARFTFMDELYKNPMVATVEADDDDAHVLHHKANALRSYLMYLVNTSIFMVKSAFMSMQFILDTSLTSSVFTSTTGPPLIWFIYTRS